MAWRGLAQRGWGCGQPWAPPAGGRSCEELTAALAQPRLLGRRFNFFIQQKCGFRKAPRKVEPRRSDTGTSSEAYKRSALIPPVEETAFYPSPYPIRTLVKPLFFTVGFTGCAFGSAAIWQYESLKSRVQSYFDGIKADWLDSIRPQKEGDFRKEINKWWNNLSDGQRTVTDKETGFQRRNFSKVTLLAARHAASQLPDQGLNSHPPALEGEVSTTGLPGIIAANVFVFCLWRVPSLQRTMIRYFTSSPASKVLCSPMLLSTFSHFSLFHMAANMYVLWSFSSSIVNILGQEQFMAVYLSAGVISNFVSYVCKVATGRYGPSLGASGAIMTVLAAVCTKIPEGRLAIIFLPMFTFTAGNALKAIIAMDTAGMILGWKFFDHAAHLGGALFGIWYITYGHELIWKNREPLVKIWHEMRTNGPKKGGGSK
ncbi:presenilin-associated rhomboid-like protein, mitochondrial isoform X1 [Physeter macrocephalus]|uniref:Presenilin-associated rhomboid-like protein, mitochondrial n=1 Tax=Physeter macrocephalus TaxID=9755 RepID=A0A9W2WLK6_PHYMC|nr:presenilins-associated rhomboid-like protein, mitochondrial isoform X1 [Physeter catodon]